MLVLSCFPGIGLLDMAFEEEGFCVVRGPDLIFGGDIRRFNPPAGRFDGVIGGPPCQAFGGLENLCRARGIVHENLIPEYERVVAEAKPSWFIMENVAGAPLPEVAGYHVHAQLVNNRWFGEQQSRKRRISFGTPRPERLILDGWSALDHPVAVQSVTSSHGGERRTHHKKATGGKITRYTVAEALMHQGLPDGHLDGTPLTEQGKLKVIAQGVPLPMGRAVARAVKRALGMEKAA